MLSGTSDQNGRIDAKYQKSRCHQSFSDAHPEIDSIARQIDRGKKYEDLPTAFKGLLSPGRSLVFDLPQIGRNQAQAQLAAAKKSMHPGWSRSDRAALRERHGFHIRELLGLEDLTARFFAPCNQPQSSEPLLAQDGALCCLAVRR